MDTPSHLDPELADEERGDRRAELRVEFADLPFELTDTHLDNYIDATHRLAEVTGRIEALGEVEIQRVTPEDVNDVLAFFDHDAFAGKPEWAMCYCRFHHVDREAEWSGRTWQQNRAELGEALRTGTMRGLLARADGRVVAWLNCSDRATSPEHATGSDDGVACTFCWAVAPPYRGHGLARALLEALPAHLEETDVEVIEGYPVEHPASDASAYVGPLSMYLGCGFEAAGEQPTTVRFRL